jgi:tetratricopeptide (TPR) repeat protein
MTSYRVWAVLLLTAGCAGRLPEVPKPTMVRSFHGTLVPGYYVSPAAYQHYLLAQLAAAEGRSQEAVDELRQAIASDAASPYLRTRLGEELLALGRAQEAREEIEAALHLDGQFPEGWVAMSRVKLRAGDTAGAEAALKRALEVDRTCDEAYLALVQLYRGQDDKIEDTWRQLVRHVPGSALGHDALGRAAIARGDLKNGEHYLLKAIELDPSREEARIALARMYQGEARFADAALQLRQAWERSGELRLAEQVVRLELHGGLAARARGLVDKLDSDAIDPERRIATGWLRLLVKQPERARNIAEDVLTAGELPSARLLLGAAFEAQGRGDDALSSLRKVPPASPQYAEAQQRIGRLLCDVGRYREALEGFATGLGKLASDGTSGEVSDALTTGLALAYERSGDRAQGIKAIETALARRPGSTALTMALSNHLARDGQWERAVETAKKLLKRHPDSAQALNFIGFTLAERGVRLDEARKTLERAVSLKPWDGGIVDSLGWLHVKLGKLDEAERLLQRADRLTPEDPEILQHLGELYAHKSDRARALETYKRALLHKPDERLRRTLEEQILLIETGRLGSR